VAVVREVAAAVRRIAVASVAVLIAALEAVLEVGVAAAVRLRTAVVRSRVAAHVLLSGEDALAIAGIEWLLVRARPILPAEDLAVPSVALVVVVPVVVPRGEAVAIAAHVVAAVAVRGVGRVAGGVLVVVGRQSAPDAAI